MSGQGAGLSVPPPVVELADQVEHPPAHGEAAAMELDAPSAAEATVADDAGTTPAEEEVDEVIGITSTKLKTTEKHMLWKRLYETVWKSGDVTWEPRDTFWGEDGVTAAFIDYEMVRTRLVGTTECDWEYPSHDSEEKVEQDDGYSTVTAVGGDTVDTLALKWQVDPVDLQEQNVYKYSRAENAEKHMIGKRRKLGLTRLRSFYGGEVLRLPRSADSEELRTLERRQLKPKPKAKPGRRASAGVLGKASRAPPIPTELGLTEHRPQSAPTGGSHPQFQQLHHLQQPQQPSYVAQGYSMQPYQTQSMGQQPMQPQMVQSMAQGMGQQAMVGQQRMGLSMAYGSQNVPQRVVHNDPRVHVEVPRYIPPQKPEAPASLANRQRPVAYIKMAKDLIETVTGAPSQTVAELQAVMLRFGLQIPNGGAHRSEFWLTAAYEVMRVLKKVEHIPPSLYDGMVRNGLVPGESRGPALPLPVARPAKPARSDQRSPAPPNANAERAVESITDSRLRDDAKDKPWRRLYKTLWDDGHLTWEERDSFCGIDGTITDVFREFEEQRTGLVGTVECDWEYPLQSEDVPVAHPDGHTTIATVEGDTLSAIARAYKVHVSALYNQNVFRYSKAPYAVNNNIGRDSKVNGLTHTYVFKAGQILRLPKHVPT